MEGDSSEQDEALSKQLADAQEQMRALEKDGWVWRVDGTTKLLSHPEDPDINIWFHPYTGEQLLSPKLVESLKHKMQCEK